MFGFRTKYVERYHSPMVREKLQERARWQESLQVPFALLLPIGLALTGTD
jgi:hypothetical protein